MPISISSFLTPTNNGTFPLLEDIYLKGGLQVVATTLERDSIPLTKRKDGMFVVVSADYSLWIYSAATSSFSRYKSPLSAASPSELGSVKIGAGLSIDASGVLSVTGATYSLPTASASVKGGIRIGSGLTMTGDVLSASVVAGVTSFNTRSGVVTLTSSDVTSALGFTPTNYALPTASASVLGGVKVGSGLSINSGVLSATAGSYSLPIASAGTLGGIRVGSGLAIDGSGILSVTGGSTYTLPNASASVLGGVKVGSGLSINASGVLNISGGIGLFGTSAPSAYPYENVTSVGGTAGWPNRTTLAGSPLVSILGTELSPTFPVAGAAPSSLFIQHHCKPNFNDPASQYVAGGQIDAIIHGGQGGLCALNAYATKKGAASSYSGGSSVNGMRTFADGRPTTHYDGILTGLWAAVHSYKSSTAGAIATCQENNAFTNFSWDAFANYAPDPFRYTRHCVIGLLINNYQQGVIDLGGSAGQYQNTFGIALTSLGPGGTNGRSYGYQTGLYIADCSQDGLRIRGGVYDSSNGTTAVSGTNTKVGIRMQGNLLTGMLFDQPCSTAAVALGNNVLNMGQYYGATFNEGDMWVNGGHLWIRLGNVNHQII